MKVQIKNLEPNPYRDMENYPVDQFKIESLKNSIEQTGFWDNIVARHKPGAKGKFQLAYGHHRLITLKELEIVEIDIPVKELDDATMIQIMANENRVEYKTNTFVTLETAKAARDFLNAELAKYESWEECPNKFIKALFEGKKGDFLHAKKGVGQTTILKFLGKQWKQWEIQDALNVLESKDIDRKAVEVFQVPKMADAFKLGIRKINKERKLNNEPIILPKEQEELAIKVKNRIIPSDGSKPKIFSAGGGSYEAMMETVIRQETDQTDEYDTAINELVLRLKKIEAEAEGLANMIGLTNGKLDEMGIDKLTSFSSVLMIGVFSRLLENINGLANRIGFNITNLK